MYSSIFKPIFFKFPAETMHEMVTRGGEFTAIIPILNKSLELYYRVSDPRLSVFTHGIHFPNPVGLSAGFDKNANATNFTHMFGFGHMELGSITGKPHPGNPKPRLFRLIKNESLIVNYGLNSDGADAVAERISRKKMRIPFGISIAKTNTKECSGKAAVDDYAYVYEKFIETGDWHTINLSCPNTPDGTPFSNLENLKPLLRSLASIREKKRGQIPILLKINADLPFSQADEIIALAKEYRVNGFVIGNLLKDNALAKKFLKYPEEYDESLSGHLSGRPTWKPSLELLRYVRKKVGKEMLLVGSGGIFSGDDAYEKIKAGADVVQLITGFVFGGPATIRTINRRLLELLERDHHDSIQDVVSMNV